MLNSFFDKYIFTNNLKYKNNNFFLMNIPFAIIPVEVLVAISNQKDTEVKRVLYSSVKENTRKNLIRQFELEFGMDKRKVMTLF